MTYKLLTINNPKILKGRKVDDRYITSILHMKPINTKICPYQDIAGCKVACLNTAGRGGIIKRGETTNVIQEARKRKTNLYLNDRPSFMEQLLTDIGKFVRYCANKDKRPAIRLNGTSDIQYEKIEYDGKNVFEHFPDVQFYDYTKIPTRKIEGIDNYHLTWSYSEANQKYAEYFDTIKYNIAVVFNTKILPIFWKGKEVIDGDESDLRFLDKQNVVVGLKAKGKAKQDMTGFVIHL